MREPTKTPRRRVEPTEAPVIGWREWIALPRLGVDWIKCKVDTGARSSSLHAYDARIYQRGGRDYVHFSICPVQRSREPVVEARAPLHDVRTVRSSNGATEVRPVILTHARLLDREWPIEVTLTDRDVMGFRMLLGRQAVRGRFLVDPGRSYFGGKPPRKGKRVPRGRKESS